MHHEELTDELIASLARADDEHGWLSIYVDASPQRHATSPPQWATPVRTGLEDLVAEAKEAGPRDRWRALVERIDALDDGLATLLDPRTAGRGRALFAPVSEGEEIVVMAQIPFPDLVDLQPTPVVGPLVVAADRHRPVGVVAVHRRGVYVAEHRLGEVEEISGAGFWVDTSDWREMKGPAGANPALPQQSSSQTDKFDRRLQENLLRRLREQTGDLRALAARRGWDRMVLVGDPRLTRVVADDMVPEGPDQAPEIIQVEKVAAEPDASDLAELVTDELERTEEQRQQRLVTGALDTLAVGDGGRRGRDEVFDAFRAGRVERVVVPDGELTDELIRAALDTSAEVNVVEGEAAARLTDSGGMAAVLRW
jgi:hypothetical protein